MKRLEAYIQQQTYSAYTNGEIEFPAIRTFDWDRFKALHKWKKKTSSSNCNAIKNELNQLSANQFYSKYKKSWNDFKPFNFQKIVCE